MNILISNDDGVKSIGLKKLAEKFSINNSVLVVAPNGNRSASAHSLTIEKPLTLEKVSESNNSVFYSLSGTPVDCVKFAKLHFSNFKPDVVVAGINIGNNVGTDILYSGTVSIALEASFFGHVAFAFSIDKSNVDYLDFYTDLAVKIVDFLMPISVGGDVWNVNFPKSNRNKGIKITKLGKQLYSDRYEQVGENKFCLVGELIDHLENDIDCDVEWLKKGYVTITPLLLNKTNLDKINEVNTLCEKLL